MKSNDTIKDFDAIKWSRAAKEACYNRYKKNPAKFLEQAQKHAAKFTKALNAARKKCNLPPVSEHLTTPAR